MGSFAFKDGIALLKTGFGGPSSGTTLGDFSQHVGGDNGQFIGDVANLGPGVVALASDMNKGAPFIVDALLSASNLISGNSICP